MNVRFSMSRRLITIVAGMLVAWGTMAAVENGQAADAPTLDRAPASDEISYRPEHDERVVANPPAFVWLPVRGVPHWIVQYAPVEDFAESQTVTHNDLSMTVHIPSTALEPGVWYWRYGYQGPDGPVYSRSRRFTVPEDAVSFPYPGVEPLLQRIPDSRPRVYYTPETVAQIREDGETFAWLTEPVIAAANAVLKRDEPLFAEPDPWKAYDDPRAAYIDAFRTMRPYTRGMETCAHAYLLTGDPRFAAEARRRLMHFMTWDVDGPSSINGPTELGMDIAEHAPRTFDWIYDTLTDDQRALCLDVLSRRIGQIHRMHRRRPFESRPFSSHPGRMIGFAVEGSIVLAHDVPEAAQWLDYTLKVLWSVYPAWGRNDGGWHEGVSYWTGYMRRMFRIVAELDRLGIPLKDKPFFQNTGDFGLWVAYPHRGHRAFGDGYEGRVGRSQADLMYTISSLYDNPYYRWYAEQMRGGPRGPESLHLRRTDLEARPPTDLPLSKAFKDIGLVAMHSRMDQPEENILLLFQSNPFGAISHNHANQNTFVLEAFGEPLAISSGYYQEYGAPHHRQWVWQTRAHNGILVDGEGQIPRSARSRGRIVSHMETGDWAYALGDAVQAYGDRLRRSYRHVLFIRPDYFVIVDDLETRDDPATFQWLLHAKQSMEWDPGSQQATIRHGQAGVRVHWISPEGLDFSQRTGWDPPPRRPSAAPPQFHLTVETTEPAQRQRFVVVLFPLGTGDSIALPPDRIEQLATDEGTALRIGDDTILIRDPDSDAVRDGKPAVVVERPQ